MFCFFVNILLISTYKVLLWDASLQSHKEEDSNNDFLPSQRKVTLQILYSLPKPGTDLVT